MTETRSQQFAVVFDADGGLQLLDTSTNEVQDLAVLEGTKRKLAARPSGAVEGVPIKTFGNLRVRSAGAMSYDIAAPGKRGGGL